MRRDMLSHPVSLPAAKSSNVLQDTVNSRTSPQVDLPEPNQPTSQSLSTVSCTTHTLHYETMSAAKSILSLRHRPVRMGYPIAATEPSSMLINGTLPKEEGGQEG